MPAPAASARVPPLHAPAESPSFFSITTILTTLLRFRNQGDFGDDDEKEDGRKTIKLLRHYAVFHASQIDGIPTYKAPTIEEAPWLRPEAADIILRNSGAVIRIGGDRAFYSPATDHIQLPPENAFRGPAEYATTGLHELAHWTGHHSRLNRPLQSRFGCATYAMEELRAEMASAFVASVLGIPTDIPHHASYIASWVKALKDDKREIFHAAADAQRIADMELGFHPGYAATMQAEPESPARAPRRPAMPVSVPR